MISTLALLPLAMVTRSAENCEAMLVSWVITPWVACIRAVAPSISVCQVVAWPICGLRSSETIAPEPSPE